MGLFKIGITSLTELGLQVRYPYKGGVNCMENEAVVIFQLYIAHEDKNGGRDELQNCPDIYRSWLLQLLLLMRMLFPSAKNCQHGMGDFTWQ